MLCYFWKYVCVCCSWDTSRKLWVSFLLPWVKITVFRTKGGITGGVRQIQAKQWIWLYIVEVRPLYSGVGCHYNLCLLPNYAERKACQKTISWNSFLNTLSEPVIDKRCISPLFCGIFVFLINTTYMLLIIFSMERGNEQQACKCINLNLKRLSLLRSRETHFLKNEMQGVEWRLHVSFSLW